METFLRPAACCRNFRTHLVFIRQFRTRSSIGLSSSSTSEQDKTIQRLWNDTFERISHLQKKREPNLNSGSTLGGKSTLGSFSGMNSGSKMNSNTSAMFSQDEQQRMKLSFAEGYFYGQENKKKPRRFIAILREATIVSLIIVAIYSLSSGDGGPFRKALLGKSTYEINPSEIITRFSDVKGCDESKKELADIVEFLKNPKKFMRLGAKLPKGVLLIGPPGTGKTLLARAVAGEAGVAFFHASGSEFDEILVGQGARRVRDLFEKAKQRTPCVIFIDEIDSVGGKRSSSVLHPHANQTVEQLLSELDGFESNEGVIVMGATNRPNDLDKALLRPGRFDVQVTVPIPDYKGRLELFKHYLSKVKSCKDIDLDSLCRNTVGMTGAAIENLVNQAALALKAALDNLDFVSYESLEHARDKILMGPENRTRVPDYETNRMTAYHEGGHALVALFKEKAKKLHKITIIPRGQALGYTSILPERDEFSQTKEQLTTQLDCLLGGRIAEELIYGSDRVTSGCSDDLKKANAIATHMVKDLGISEKVGMRVIREEENQNQIVVNNFSDATHELVETEIQKILSDSENRVKELLTKHLNELKLLAEALLKYQTLDASEVKLIIECKDPRITRQDKEREKLGVQS